MSHRPNDSAGFTRAWTGFIVCCLFLLAGCTGGDAISEGDVQPGCIPPGQAPVEAQVVDIADGDSITVRIDGQEYRLRYIGINAPEMDADTQKDLAQDAYEFNRQLVEDQTLILYRDTSETDRYERLLRYVMVGDTFVNYELVRRGQARAQDYPPDSACKDMLAEAERQAIDGNLGIWAGD